MPAPIPQERVERFLELLAKDNSVTMACNQACINREWVYRHAREDEDFAEIFYGILNKRRRIPYANAKKYAKKGSPAFNRQLIEWDSDVDVETTTTATNESLANKLIEDMNARNKDAEEISEEHREE